MKQEEFYSKLKNTCADDGEIERTIEVSKALVNENGEQLTKFYCQSDLILLADVFDKIIKVSTKKYGMNALCCVPIHSCISQCGSLYTDDKLQTLQDNDTILLVKNNIRGGIGSVMGDKDVFSDEKRTIL